MFIYYSFVHCSIQQLEISFGEKKIYILKLYGCKCFKPCSLILLQILKKEESNWAKVHESTQVKGIIYLNGIGIVLLPCAIDLL